MQATWLASAAVLAAVGEGEEALQAFAIVGGNGLGEDVRNCLS